jgi:glutamine synthetase
MERTCICATVRVCETSLRPCASEGLTDRVIGNPSRLSEAERSELGIVTRLPTTIEQSLGSLEGDKTLRDALGTQVVTHFVTMKTAEQEMLNVMSESERRVWLMERY